MPGHLTVVVSGSERQVEQGTTAAQLLQDAGPAHGPQAVVVARVNGELRDLAHQVAGGDVVEPVTIDSPDGLAVLRHSTAHVLAQAVQELFPQARLGIGPPVTDGFYYDFDVEQPFTPEDTKRLEKVMQRIIKEGQRFSRRVTSDDAAREELAAEPYKLELIGLKGSAGQDVAAAAEGAGAEVGGGELTIYDNLRRDDSVVWKDLCRGPHLPSTRLIGNGWSLTRTAAAYWRGSEQNPQLQRVYGTAWPSKDELVAYKERLAEAERRDHRKLGAELDLFSFPDEIGSGMAVFHPKGGVIKREMEDYVRRRHIEEGFDYVGTPHISKDGLFHTSGHLPYYADTMFPPMELEHAEYRLKAMNCPMHNLIFRSRGRSYRELPLAVLRVRVGVPVREVGRGPRPDPGARHDPGRLALLRHPRAGAGGDRPPAAVRGRPAARLRPRRLLLRAVHPRQRGRQEGQVHRQRRAVGGRDRGAAQRRREVRRRARRRPRRCRVLRSEDLGPGTRRDRPHLADVDHPVRLQPA